MPRRKDSFARALADAKKRLAKAQAERNKAEHRLHELSTEIPQLQSIIASLGEPEARPITERAGSPGLPPPPNVPPELAKYLGPQDMTGIGSVVPIKPAAPTKIETEDDTLPEPEGEELSE